VALLTQARQSRAALIVKRPSFPKLIPIDLVPAELADPSVTRVFLIEDGIGHIKIANFEQQTADELRNAIEQLGGHNLTGLILDLRGNPGGVIEAAAQSTTFF
jgi:carboxyl-terminal processing protease